MHIALLLVALLNLAGTAFLILRKPRSHNSGIIIGTGSSTTTDGPRLCGQCGLLVNRYRPHEDGSVVCVNCKPLED